MACILARAAYKYRFKAGSITLWLPFEDGGIYIYQPTWFPCCLSDGSAPQRPRNQPINKVKSFISPSFWQGGQHSLTKGLKYNHQCFCCFTSEL